MYKNSREKKRLIENQTLAKSGTCKRWIYKKKKETKITIVYEMRIATDDDIQELVGGVLITISRIIC